MGMGKHTLGEFAATRMARKSASPNCFGDHSTRDGRGDDVKIHGAGDHGLGGTVRLLVVAAEGTEVLFGFDRLELDEPAFEDRLSDFLESLVDLAILSSLFIQS